MKKIFYFMFVFVLSFSCGDNASDDAATSENTSTDISSEKLKIERYHRNETKYDNNGACRLIKNDKLVTGTVYQEWDNGTLIEEANYKSGMLNGRSQEWYENGQKRLDHNYIMGKKEGRQRFWNKYGELLSDDVWGPDDY